MHQPKFLTLLSTLTEEEAHDFLKHVKKTHPKGKAAHKLLADILKFVDGDIGNKVLDIEYAQKRVFEPSKKNTPKKKVQNALSEISQWLEDFLLIRKVSVDSFERDALWLSVLMERKPGTMFLKAIDQMDGNLAKLPKPRVGELMKRMFLSHFRYYGQDYSKLNEDDSALRSYESHLNQFYIVAKLKVLCERLNRTNVLGTEAPSAEIEDMAKHYVETSPLMALYLDAYRLLKQRDDESYQKAEFNLKQRCNDIAPSELTRIIDYLQNFAATRIREKQHTYWPKIHELDVLCVDNKWLEHHEGMSATKFVNMVTAACRVGAIDWAMQFIENQHHLLPSESRSMAITLANATIRFEQEDFAGVVKLLHPINTTIKKTPYPHDKIRAMILYIQGSYEQGDPTGELLEQCTNCENNLRNTYKSNIEAVVSVMNFIGFIKSMLRKKDSPEMILERINTTTPLTLDDWLRKMAERL